MARKKVKLEWIANDAARRATFKKRRKGLMKKVSELSTLCDVKACLIVYGHNEPVPEVWPSTQEAVHVVAKLQDMPHMEQSKKMMNQEGFMRQRIAKLQDQLRKLDRENRELDARLLMNQSLMGMGLEGIGAESVTSLAWLIETELSMAKKRIEGYKGDKGKGKAPIKVEETPQLSAMTMAATAKEKSPMEVAMEELQRQEWFTDVANPNMHQESANAGFYGGSESFGGWPYGGQSSSSNPSSGNINPWVDPYFPWN